MRILALDFGSSSVKAAILRGTKLNSKIARATYPTRYDGLRAELNPQHILKALQQAIRSLGPQVRKIETIAIGVMSPAWIAMDHQGKPITPLITHQDRRSLPEAQELERRLGKHRYLKLAGNLPAPARSPARPGPGSSTTSRS